MKSKNILYIFALLLSFMSVSCVNKVKETSMSSTIPEIQPSQKITGEALEYYRTIDEIVQKSDVGIEAICVGKEVHNEFIDFVFNTGRCLWGIAEETVRIRVYYNIVTVVSDNGKTVCEYETGINSFETGKAYFLVAEKRSSLIYEHKHIYLINGGLIISIDDKTVWFHGEKQDIPEDHVTEECFWEIYMMVPHEDSAESMSSKSYDNSFDEMWNESEYVVRIRLTDVEYDGEGTATNAYNALVLEQYKGNPINVDKANGNRIIVALLKGTVTVGEEYIVGISGARKGNSKTLAFVQETENSVYHIDDDILDKIRNALQ